eukprot:CAMPEP_0195286790 /NCGR_PEP_ID=MMETSP0707-20130614/4116_1 /TAXON_ID=33640 /ORGANISM="Asterionellopsis glacialis, Strain CCMP134" /LENGTH=231 /DNA_ID=CAMNT_0040346477 /DNA_START=72 /DNA_END=767 /DNA_ORIENTATION=+
MPKSKRSKAVVLTQTSKKTREHKSEFVQDVRDAIDNHDTLYLFSYENMRSNKFKSVRLHFREPDMEGKGSRIFLGKNKLLQLAMGKTMEEEYADNLRHVAKLTSGSVGLLFTSRPTTEVEEFFDTLVEDDFARAGFESPRDVIVTNEMVSNHPVSMMEMFRKLGLPVQVQNGKVVLIGGKTEHKLCKQGEVLTAEQCKALLQFGIKLSEFRIQLVCRWSASNGDFQMLEDA